MNARGSTVLVAAVAAMALVSSAPAQESTIKTRSNLVVASSANMDHISHNVGLSNADAMFLKDVAKAHMAEIQMGQIAQKNGGDWGRAYGKDMEREHSLALEELKKIAAEKGVSLPSDVDKSAKRMSNMLAGMHGAAFDSHYRKMMIADHNKDLAKVQSEIRGGRDEMVRGYAVTLEPAVKLHLRMAREQTTMMGGNSG
jgi:putative membrane protein